MITRSNPAQSRPAISFFLLSPNQFMKNERNLKQDFLWAAIKIALKLCMLLCLVSAQGVGAQVYVSSGAGLSVVDPSQTRLIAQLPLGFSLLALSPDGRRIYGSDVFGLTVVDTVSKNAITTIAVGIRPGEAVLSPDGNRVYVATPDSSSVAVVDTQSNLIIATIPLAASPNRLAIKPDGTRLYVGTLSNGVKIIDTTTNTKRLRVAFVFGVLTAIMMLSSCGGGGGSTPPPPPGPVNVLPGTYQLTVNATAGNLSKGITLNLTVQ